MVGGGGDAGPHPRGEGAAAPHLHLTQTPNQLVVNLFAEPKFSTKVQQNLKSDVLSN
jgi:hypothetical protein